MTSSAANDSGDGAGPLLDAPAAVIAGSAAGDRPVHAEAVHVGLVAGFAAVEALQADGDQDVDEEEDEEFEVEDALDDEPIHVAGRVFLGSVDAANNTSALRRCRIGRLLSLLGVQDEHLAVDMDVPRTLLRMEDALDEDLLAQLPAALDKLRRLMYVAHVCDLNEGDATDWECWSSEEAERLDQNVLVHCVAGRSRSPAVVVAWLVAQDPETMSVQDASDSVRVVRPWIDMNARFVRDLMRFHALLTADATTAGSSLADVDWHKRNLPRLDFDVSLVDSILSGRKLVTMRMETDVQDDGNSDLARISACSAVAATTGDAASSSSRHRFALLRVDRVETCTLCEADAETLAKSGFRSSAEVLAVLRRFYPRVTMDTPLRMLHFQFLLPQ